MMNEFETIRQYFRPLTMGHDDLQDDAAVLQVPDGFELVVSSDTLNAGVHFLEEAAPANIAHKVLRVNLSDLAAMGAKPLAYQLNIAFPEKPDEVWLAAFTQALLADQERFGIFCSGGDTTSTKGPLSISITAMGLVETGKAWRRGGAQDGDQIILTHPVGDAWLGLQILRGDLKTPDDDYFIERYYKPHPRFLDGPVRAAIDISDGLIADLGHICHASHLAAAIEVEAIVFSDPARILLDEGLVSMPDLLSGGDDYELLLATVPDDTQHLINDLKNQGYIPQVIGSFHDDPPGVRVMDKNGQAIDLKTRGWVHF